MNVGDQFDKSEVRMTSRCSHLTSTSVYCLVLYGRSSKFGRRRHSKEASLTTSSLLPSSNVARTTSDVISAWTSLDSNSNYTYISYKFLFDSTCFSLSISTCCNFLLRAVCLLWGVKSCTCWSRLVKARLSSFGHLVDISGPKRLSHSNVTFECQE